MKRYEWMPGRLFYILVLLALALVGTPVALAQDTYPIQNVIATSNAISEEGEGPENTVNGSGLDANNEHSTKATDMWLVELDDGPVYIQYEFDGVYKLQEMWVWNYNTQFELLLGFGVKEVTIEYSVNGTNWAILDDVELAQATATADYTANTIVPLGGISAQYVRLTIRSGWGPLGRFGLSEVRFVTGSEPDPSQDAHLIQNIIATSNAISEEGEGPENTVNGSGLNTNDEHSTKATDMWLGELDDEPVYIQYEFDGVYELQEMWVWNYNVIFESILGFGVKEVTIEYSVNGTNWTILDDVELAQATATADYTANTIVPLGGVSAKYIRLTIRSGWGVLGQAGLSEVRFLTGSEPEPPQDADSITNVVATSNAISEEGTGPENTVNGSGLNANNEHSTKATDMWLVKLEGGPVYIQYEFDDVYKLQEMWVWNYNVIFESILGFGVKEVTIEYSVNGMNWTILDDVEFAQATAMADYTANTVVPLGGVSAKYIRLTIRSGWGPLGQVGLSEVRFFSNQN